MKVGDLVIMPGSAHGHYEPYGSSIGVIVKVPRATDSSKRVGVYWMDGEGHVDWEPVDWLEVINETRP